MADPRDNPVKFFHTQFPDEPLRVIAKAVAEATVQAGKRCKEYPDEEAHDLIGHLRRAEVENAARFAAKRFGEIGVKASSRTNSAGNYHHTLIRCGQVAFTIHKVDSLSDMVSDALFRQEYARSAQLHMFEPNDDALPNPDTLLYGYMLYVPDADRLSRPAYLAIRFPDKNCAFYVDESPIDLYGRFPDLLDGDGDSGASAVPSSPPRLPVPITKGDA